MTTLSPLGNVKSENIPYAMGKLAMIGRFY